ncbi:MAG TPA: hypothetical protein VII01_02570 [Solirubrobacteraceae bacterium]
MNDHLGQLEQALSDAAVRHYGSPAHSRAARDATSPARNIGSPAPRDRWRSVRRWSPFAVVALLLAIAAAAAAAIVVLVERGSAPLTGTVPNLRVLHYDVSLTPDLEAGDAGWCSFPRFWVSGVSSPYYGGGTCAPAYRPGFPIVSSAEQPISNARNLLRSSHTALTAPQGNSNLFSAIVTSRVAAIRLRPGDIVTARADHRLAPGWKAVIAFVSGQIDPVALDSAGRVIPENGTAPQLTRAATRAYALGSSAASSPCSIRAPRLPYVTASWGVIATRVATLGTAVDANVLFSCARSWYSIKGSTNASSATILLSARRPQDAAPTLPGLEATAHPGVFSEDGGADGPILGRRVGRAWLVVQGPSISTDAMLLGALRAEGTAVGVTQP